jgi:hypothetical protein
MSKPMEENIQFEAGNEVQVKTVSISGGEELMSCTIKAPPRPLRLPKQARTSTSCHWPPMWSGRGRSMTQWR